MKKIGLLFGCELLIDTDNEEIAQDAINHLEKLHQDQRELDQIKTLKEAGTFHL